MLLKDSPGSPAAADPHDRGLITAGTPGPKRPGYISFKVAFEWIVALMIFVPVAPLIGLLWAFVRLTSDGPGFYRQTRLGKNGKAYVMLKLRSMAKNAEAATGAVWCSPGDARVTPIGRILRDTHLDELPQLWNILRGEMSLIGPRPERPELVKKIEVVLPHYRDRLQVNPGLTGFAQIQHGADTDLDHVRRKLMYDLYYIREMSFGVDMRIAAGTVLYFMGVTFTALCKQVIKPYAKAVDDADASPTPVEAEAPVGAGA